MEVLNFLNKLKNIYIIIFNTRNKNILNSKKAIEQKGKRELTLNLLHIK